MNDARDNRTDSERARMSDSVYTLPLYYKWRASLTWSRLWFREESDRQAFAQLVTALEGQTNIVEYVLAIADALALIHPQFNREWLIVTGGVSADE